MANTTSPEDTDRTPLMFGASDRLELVATIILAIATVLTAWSAFQSTKWSGKQSINFSVAAASRTESARADTQAGQLTQIDVAMFSDWATAVIEEVQQGTIAFPSDGSYEPTPGTRSGFIYNRFREEFRPAVDAWIETDPVNNPDAPTSPFVMTDDDGAPVYVLQDRIEADRLAVAADASAALAREANQNGDNYVFTMVLFASVLFFAGVSSKLVRIRNRVFVLGFGVVLLVGGSIILLSLPILTLRA